MKYAVLSHSGGLDSSTLLLRLLHEGYHVTALHFDYGQKHKIEIERAAALCDYLRQHGFAVNHQRITLEGLEPLLHSHLVAGGEEVPEGHYHDENMKATVVPNRNKIFSSIIQAVALSIAEQENTTVNIALGIHAGDHVIYPDCRPEFREADYRAFVLGNWKAEQVSYYTPYIELDKTAILKDGLRCCEALDLDYRQVYSRTFTSYKPINIDGQWYSDYKSASSVERIEAFIALGIDDPAAYADENGPQPFSVAKAHVEKNDFDKPGK